MQNRITVIALDDHSLILEGIASHLAKSPDIALVGQGGSGEELDALMKVHRPNVAVVDLGMPQKSGGTPGDGPRFRALPALLRLRQLYPQTQIVILTQEGSPDMIAGAADIGVHGYLLKDDVLSSRLSDAIRAVAAGGMYFSPEVLKRIQRRAKEPKPDVLSQRQIEILCAVVAEPCVNHAELAQRMGITDNTFGNHLRRVYERLEVGNIMAAVLKALELGIISPAWLGRQSPSSGSTGAGAASGAIVKED